MQRREAFVTDVTFIMLKQAIFLVGFTMILLFIMRGNARPIGTSQDLQLGDNVTSLMCDNDEFGKAGCLENCQEKTTCTEIHMNGGYCLCKACADTTDPPIGGQVDGTPLDDGKDYRCNAYCKRMMKNCFDGICDKSKGTCVCRYCS